MISEISSLKLFFKSYKTFSMCALSLSGEILPFDLEWLGGRSEMEINVFYFVRWGFRKALNR